MNILILFVILTIISFCKGSTDDTTWYPSSPLIRIDQQSICPSSMGVYFARYLYPPYQMCCVIYSYQCGLSVVCVGDDSLPTIFDQNLQIFIQDMIIQPNTSNLWIVDPDFIYLYDISDPQQGQLTQKAKIAKQPNAGITFSIQYFEETEGRLFVSSTGGVDIYNIQIPIQVAFVSTIPAQQRAQKVTIVPSINTIFLVDGNYRIMKITNAEDIQLPQKAIQVQDQCSFPFPYVSFSEVVNSRYLIVQSISSILSGADLTDFLISGDCNQINIITLFSNSDTFTLSYLSQNKQFIIIGLNNVCLQVIEMNYDKFSARLFQKIPITNYLFYFQISPDQQFVLISNLRTIDIFQRKIPNYNTINPSILNQPQVIAYEDTFVSSSPLQPYACQYTPINNQIIYTKGLQGTLIIEEDQDSHFMYIKKQINPPKFTSNLRMSRVFNDEKTLIIGRDSSIYIYDISDIDNPILLSSTNFGFNGIQIRQGYITKNQQYALLSGDLQGVLVADISNLTKPVLITTIYHNLPLATRCYFIDMPSNEKYAIASYLYQGLVIYDFSNFAKPFIVSYFNTYSASSTIFMKNENYLVKSDMVNGLAILDVSDMKNPVQYSQISIESSSKECVLIRDDDFMLCTSRYFGQLKLVDLRDLKNPVILQKYNYKQFIGGYCVCVSTDQQVLYLGLLSAIVRINLYPNIQFQKDILLLQEGTTDKNQFLDDTTIIEVGMKVKVTLSQVYPDNIAVITGVKFYNDFKIQDLPYWASFSVVDSSLIAEFDKNSIQSNLLSSCSESQSSTQNCQTPTDVDTVYSFQFVFLISQKLASTDFINSNLNIDSALSNQIFIDCITTNIINPQYYFIESTFEVANYVLQAKYQLKVIQFIFYTLSRKCIYYPVVLQLKSSLVADIDDENKVPKISSILDYLYIQLTIESLQAQFIPFTYSGVLTYLSDKCDWMKIEGDLESINIIISKGFKLANFTQAENIPIVITIDDTTNFPITKTLYASHKYLIQLNQPIRNNMNQNLQDDFDKKYSDSSIYIMDTFSYTFNSIVFINPDSRSIIYEAGILQSDGNYVTLPQQYWLLFQKEERTFIGSPKSNQFGDTVRIRVNATDGYTYAVDYFEIKINLIPISLILQYFFSIVGPLIGLFGMWKYLPFLYNQMNQEKYITTRIELVAGEGEVVFQIPILGKKLEKANKLWKDYFKFLNKKEILIELNQIKSCAFVGGESNILQKSDNQDSKDKLSQFLKNSPMMKDRSLSNSRSKSLKFQKQFSRMFSHSITKKVSKNVSQFQPKQPILKQRSQMGLQYFNYDNTINQQCIINGVLQQYKKAHLITETKIVEQLNNPLSMLYRAIIGLAAIQFSQLDKSIVQIINYLKQVAKEQGYKDTDWYKYYAKIIPQTSRIHIDQFPLVDIDESFLTETLTPILNMHYLDKQDQIHKYQLQLQFIKEVISAIALGLTPDKFGLIPKIRGECLEIKSHEIQSIRTYRPRNIKKRCLRRLVSEVLVEKEFFQIQVTPSWVQSIDLTNKVILIKGRTENKDIGEYVMNIYNKQNFIIKSIRVVIVPKKQVLSQIQIGQDVLLMQDSIKYPSTLNDNKEIDYSNEDVPHESGFTTHYFEKSAVNSKPNQNQQQFNTIFTESSSFSPHAFNIHNKQIEEQKI